MTNSSEFVKPYLEGSVAIQSNLHFVIRTPAFIWHILTPSITQLNWVTHLRIRTMVVPMWLDHAAGCSACGASTITFPYSRTTQQLKPTKFFPFSHHRSLTTGDTSILVSVYDCFSENYKCVRICQTFHDEKSSLESQIMVYSLKLNSWRRVQHVPCYFYYHHEESKVPLLVELYFGSVKIITKLSSLY